jgi:hypothetical protein
MPFTVKRPYVHSDTVFSRAAAMWLDSRQDTATYNLFWGNIC